MGKRRRALIILFLILISAITAALAFTPSDPLYNGKRLSQWMEGYYTGMGSRGGPSQEDTQAALLALGSNAVPTLVRMLKEDDSTLKTQLIILSKKYPFPHLHLVRAYVKHEAAEKGFRRLGAQAQCAVPALIESLKGNLSLDSREHTIKSLGWIGPPASNAVPVLIRDSSNTNENIRKCAIMALRFIHATPEAIIPLLIKGVTDNNTGVRLLAAQSLGYYTNAAQPSVPALILALQDKDSTVREVAERSLIKIDPEEAFFARIKIKPKNIKRRNPGLAKP